MAALLLAEGLTTSLAFASGDAQLLLPLVAAMAFGVSAVQEPEAPASAVPFTTPAPPRRKSLLPSRLQIPDGYAIDVDRNPPRFVTPVDRDRIVGLDLMGRPRHGWTASLTYDEESRHPLPGSGELFRLIFKRRF